MKMTILALGAITTLAACGGGNATYSTRGFLAPTQLYATGPIQRACESDGRRGASNSRCGCIQAVADRELSNAEQRRGVKAFKDPHKLQVWRQSDRASHNAFWSTWKAYGQRAASLCSAS